MPYSRPNHSPNPRRNWARHIAAAEIRFLETTINAEFPTAAGLPESVKTPAEVASWYSENFGRHFEKLTQLKGDHLMKITDFLGIFNPPPSPFLQSSLTPTTPPPAHPPTSLP